MPDQRPIGECHASSTTNRRLTGLIEDRHATSNTDTPLMGPQSGMSVSYQACWSLIRHVGLKWVCNEACWSDQRRTCQVGD